MEHYFILNLFLVVTMLSVWYPTEVQGYKSLDYPAGGFYNYPWRRFNHLKRTDSGGDWPDNDNSTNYPIIFTDEPPRSEWDMKKSSTNKKRLSNVTPGYGIKVLYGRVPGTVMFWPSAL